MSTKAILETNLGSILENKIQHLVKSGEFKSRDDFIELACAEQLALRYQKK
jgi:Arc/MetJ-type ribon-helix-helix transcriptional regulator